MSLQRPIAYRVCRRHIRMPDTKKCTYETLLGPLGVKPTVSAECLFADPVADIAILSGPDSQALFDQAEAYEEFMDDKVPLIIGDAPKEGRKQVVLPGDGPFAGSFTIKTPRRGSARLLSLDGKWLDCSVERYGRGLSVVDDDLVRSGMSGSPIVMADLAIGLISHRPTKPNP